jgi:hypothetical protein
MNELFAADPAVIRNTRDLRLLLNYFGPYAGRYLAKYPSEWSKMVEGQFAGVDQQVQLKGIKSMLEGARNEMSLITRTGLDWNSDKDWLKNASALLASNSPVFDGLIANQSFPPSIQLLDEFRLPPTSGRYKVRTTANEYGRICKVLLLESREIFLIDPYLNPTQSRYRPVLQELFRHAACGMCQRIVIWARASLVIGSCNPSVIVGDIERILRQLAVQGHFKTGSTVQMNLVEDETCEDNLHHRSILSIKGGVIFDRGFPLLRTGRTQAVTPMAKDIHDELLDIYLDGQHDMKVKHQACVKI